MTLELQAISPLISIFVFAVAALMVDVFSGSNKKMIYYFSITGLIITGLLSIYTLSFSKSLIATIYNADSITKGNLIYGGLASFFDIIFVIAGLMTLITSGSYLRKKEHEIKEFYTLILYSIAGMMLISHSGNLLMLFIGIETMSLSFYILAGYFRTEMKSVEAALKYFLLGAFATGFLLFGIAFLYGAAGSIDLSVIGIKSLQNEINNTYFIIGLGLITISLSFKVAAFPFHQWAPDVYEGSPTVITGFMSTAGKAAALAAFLIIAQPLFQIHSLDINVRHGANALQMIIAIISALTMLVGNITALVQKNIKRMLAYSSIAHAGYLLMGIVAANQRGWSGIVFYATVYMFMQIGAFIVVALIEEKGEQGLQLDDYTGLSKKQPVVAALMALFMLSLAGIPPMAGFFGKYYLFLATIEAGFTWLTIIAVISSIISVYFYIGLIVNMYFKDPISEGYSSSPFSAMSTLVVSAIMILVIGFFPDFLIDLLNKFI
jgi:NADH-quinone oxidoreductase subunit N